MHSVRLRLFIILGENQRKMLKNIRFWIKPYSTLHGEREGKDVADYTLYMDESETFNDSGNKYFVMSGVIIKNSNYSIVESSLNAIKRMVWNNANGCEQCILHEKDVSYASNRLNSHRLNAIPSCYHIFQKKNKVVLLYNELSKLFKNSDIVTIGVCLDKTVLHSCYGEMNLNN